MMMMTENDYIAEYIKEKKPQMLKSLNFMAWKTQAMSKNMKDEIADAIKKAINEEMVIKAAADPEFDDESYYEFLTQKGKEYCKKHRGGDSCMCGNCPLSENMCCINEVGALIINDDCTNIRAAVSQYKYMIREVTKVDQN